jgi:regulator of cell morphogenesis and NO signaling
MITLETIDVTLIEPKLKHPTLFQKFAELNAGEGFIISNDHDPRPLYYQLLAENGNVFNWEYREEGPDTWQVILSKKTAEQAEQTIGELVAKDFRRAEIFKKFKIDFCCGGKKTLSQVCKEKKLDLMVIEKELEKSDLPVSNASQNYNNWTLSFLVDHIVNTHHHYVKTSIPTLLQYTEKVSKVHGKEHPEVIQIAGLFQEIADELAAHMRKEEEMLFPYIKQLELSASAKTDVERAGFGSVQNPIRMMEHEHETVGELFRVIDELSSNYTPPEDACATYKVSFLKLKEFEDDLHQHIHLENNILFPKSVQLENS